MKKLISNAPNTLGIKTDSCVFDEKYEHSHSMYSSGEFNKYLPKKLEFRIKGTDKAKRIYQLGSAMVDISKYLDEPETCISLHLKEPIYANSKIEFLLSMFKVDGVPDSEMFESGV